ncbi:MAG: agmatinase [Methanomassiliicoccaceae archaeon]|jgi:agmatinase|nr:agmatinase [Methanomassiliicoccaceae archaeon]
MLNGIAFADADSTFSDADVIIYGIPYDRTTSFRSGSREAPGAVRRASYNFEVTHFEHGKLPMVAVHDFGDIDDHIYPEDMMDDIRFSVTPAIRDKKFTVAIGGEHSVTSPIVSIHDKISVISVDAHLDSRDEFLGSPYSHACVMRRCVEHVGIDNVFVLGVRSICDEELDRDDIVPHITSFEIMDHGMERAIGRALDSVRNEKIYLTIDIDGVDPAFAPGTGTQEPFGLLPIDVKRLINSIGDRLIGMDVVEISPPYDPSGITAVLGARYIKEGISVYSKHHLR